jgi:hypothetical protein
MSPFQRGAASAVGLIGSGAAGFAALVVFSHAHLHLSDEALSDMAQIGATLLVAYAVEMSWFVKESRARGSKRENWIGFVAGIGGCSALGIAIAVALVGDQGSARFIQALGALWMLFSLGFLLGLVGVLPYLLYEMAHSLRTEDPDE